MTKFKIKEKDSRSGENSKKKQKKAGQLVPDKNADIFSPWIRWFLVSLIIFFAIAVRVRLLDIPLERDEGEYAYMGQMLLQGVPPYGAAYTMKLPGTFFMYACIMSLFGQSIRGIHLGFLIINCATIILIFHLGRKMVNDLAGIISGAAYAVLSLSSSVWGFAAHATHFVVLPTVGGILILLSTCRNNRPYPYFLSGVVFGLSFLMKQPGFFFLLFGASYILYGYWSSKSGRPLSIVFRDLILFLLGGLLPFTAVVLWVYVSGTFDRFWFWTVQYASEYASQVSISKAFTVFKENLLATVDGFPLLWVMSVLGLFVVLFNRESKTNRAFIVLFAIFSFLSICPGFYFREHYFVTLFPAISLLAGIFINYLSSRNIAMFQSLTVKFMFIGFFSVLMVSGIFTQWDYLFKDDPYKIERNVYGTNPFPESVEIAQFIEGRSSKTDTIAVLGSEPQIYFYSKRRAATGYIYTYGLMENHSFALTMQKEMAREIEISKPKFIIAVNVATSWLARQDSETFIFNWINNYVPKNYSLVGVADIVFPHATIFKWNIDAQTYVTTSKNFVRVFERK